MSHHVGLDLLHGVLVAGFVGDVHLAVGVEARLLLWWAVSSPVVVVPIIVIVVISPVAAASVVAVSSVVVVVAVSSIIASVRGIVVSIASSIVVRVSASISRIVVVISIASSVVVVVIVVAEVVGVVILHLACGNACSLIVRLLLIAVPVMARIPSVLSATELVGIAIPSALVVLVVVVIVVVPAIACIAAATRMAVVIGRRGIGQIRLAIICVVSLSLWRPRSLAKVISTSPKVTCEGLRSLGFIPRIVTRVGAIVSNRGRCLVRVAC